MTHSLKTHIAAAVLLIVMTGCGPAVDDIEARAAGALDDLQGAAVHRHVTVLAADAMEGREAGTPGHRRAADYVAARFAAFGLEPLGDGDSFFQQVAFMEARLVEGSATMTLTRGDTVVELEHGRDFAMFAGFGVATDNVTAPLTFVGFGIQAPEYGHDDYAGIDVRGKLVVALTGAPPRFGTDERAYYSSGEGKAALAVSQGAVGMLSVRAPFDLERLTWERMLHASSSPSLRWLTADGAPHAGFPELRAQAMLGDGGVAQMFALADIDVDDLVASHVDGATGSIDLGVTATLARRSAHRRIDSPNVLARLPGSDPRLREEHVLYSAHLDHLGTRPHAEGDRVFNGAYDNATGVAVILEIARALAQLQKPPRRSFIFAAVTAEEKGLRGSDYLARHPPVPIDRIVANLNIDMPYLGFPIENVEGLGVEHSTLAGMLDRAATHAGLRVSPDPHPDLVRFIRSDQFSFVKQGVPGLNLKPGSHSADPATDGAAMLGAFLRERYHAPGDDLSQAFSDVGATSYLRTAFMLGVIAASDEEAPRWNADDYFGDRFGR